VIAERECDHPTGTVSRGCGRDPPGRTAHVSAPPHADPTRRRAVLPLASALIVLGVILATALMVLLVAVLGGEGAGSPKGTVGGRALTAVHQEPVRPSR